MLDHKTERKAERNAAILYGVWFTTVLLTGFGSLIYLFFFVGVWP